MNNIQKYNNINKNINILQKKTYHITNNKLINLRFQNINYFLNAIQDEIDNLDNELNNNLYLNQHYIKKTIENEKYYNDSIKFLTTLYTIKN